MRHVAILIFTAGVMLLGAGIALGFTPVEVAPGTSCGSAFQGADAITNGLTESGEETCTEARTAHRPAAAALLVAGGVGVIGGAYLVYVERDRARRLPPPEG